MRSGEVEEGRAARLAVRVLYEYLGVWSRLRHGICGLFVGV